MSTTCPTEQPPHTRQVTSISIYLTYLVSTSWTPPCQGNQAIVPVVLIVLLVAFLIVSIVFLKEPSITIVLTVWFVRCVNGKTDSLYAIFTASHLPACHLHKWKAKKKKKKCISSDQFAIKKNHNRHKPLSCHSCHLKLLTSIWHYMT